MLALRISQEQTDFDAINRCSTTRDKMSLKESLVSFAALSSSKSTLSRYATSDARSVFTTPRTSMSSYTTVSSGNGMYYENVPRLVKTPWEADRSRRSATMPRSNRRPGTGRSLPERIFREMPDEIYQCIVQQLEKSYFSDDSGTCVHCYMRDLYNLSLTSHTWYRAARQQLYAKIWLVNDGHAASSDLPWTAMKLLRRTLRDRPFLARFVKELHFPDAQIVYQAAQMKDRQAIINTLASLVMAAPNLEKFSGLYLTYDHIFDRLTHALSTRHLLKEKTWVLRRSDVGMDDDGIYWSNHDEYGQADNHDAFLQSHMNWQNLETLCLFGQTTGRMDYRSFVATFRSLPALKHLLISDFDASQFNDRTLFAIPPGLHSLRLQDIPAVTEKGLARFFGSFAAMDLRNISLVKLEITSATLIAHIFAKCVLLKRFTLAQDISPALPLGLAAPSDDGIVYRSNSLEYLHWDTVAYGPSLQDLANSLAVNAFPALKMLRAPSDDGGLLQRMCAPSRELAKPSDIVASVMEDNPFGHSSLPAARREAQRRKDEASKDPFIKIVVSDEEGTVQHTYTLRTYMGTLQSNVKYSLDPDVLGSEDFIAGLNDLLVSREGVLEGERYCSEELSSARRYGGRASFESGTSGGSGNSGGSVQKALVTGVSRAKTVGRKRGDTLKGHRMRKVIVNPDSSIFF